MFGIYIKSAKLSVGGKIRLARGCGGGKAEDLPGFRRYDGLRLERVPGREVVFVGSIFGTELIEVVFGEECPVSNLP